MRYQHLSFVVAAATLIGCGDSSEPTQIARPTITPTSRAATLIGTVVQNTTDRSGALLALHQEDGTETALTGAEAGTMATVIGDDVEVSGTIDDVGQLTVQRFVLLAVGGQQVLDGVLEMTDDGGFTLDLTIGGFMPVADPPTELQQYVGDRVWISGLDGQTPMTFGVIRVLTRAPLAARPSRPAPRASLGRDGGKRL